MEHTTEKRLTKFSEKSYNGNPKCPTGSRTLHSHVRPETAQPTQGEAALEILGEVDRTMLEGERAGNQDADWSAHYRPLDRAA